MDNSAYNLVLSTVPSIDEARYIARDLVQKKLVACVNIVPDLTSVYEWDGELHEDSELLLVIKTRTDLLDSLIERIVEIHTYDVPEVICLPIIKGHNKYLDWIDSVTALKTEPEVDS